MKNFLKFKNKEVYIKARADALATIFKYKLFETAGLSKDGCCVTHISYDTNKQPHLLTYL